MLAVVDLSRAPTFVPAGMRCGPLQGGSRVTLLALAKQLSSLKIADLSGAGHKFSVSPGRAVRFSSVTGESEFSSI